MTSDFLTINPMLARRYKAADISISTIRRVLRSPLRITGVENIVNQPTVFVPNHFTRLETILMPYAIYKSCGRVSHTLGMAGLFSGTMGKILSGLGVMSVKHPNRNRMIIRELMTSQFDWIIYAEGGLIKNKKVVAGGRLHLTHPQHTGSPHTGAAMLALKAEISRQRYLWACKQEDMLRREFYEREYGVVSPEQISQSEIVVQPVTITFHPMRAVETWVSRLAGKISKSLNAKVLEELTFESAVLAKHCEIGVHFGKAISAADFLDVPTEFARRLIGRFGEERRSDVLLRRQARKLTRVVMRNVYNNVEVNFDHLFATALRRVKTDRIAIDDLRGALFLTTQNILSECKTRVHPSLAKNVPAIATAARHEPFERAVELAVAEKIVTRDGDDLIIDRRTLTHEGDFDSIRLRNMTHVLTNEIEPQSHLVDAVARTVNLDATELRRRVAESLHRMHVSEYRGEYEKWYQPTASKPVELGHPFHLESNKSNVGILLAHGYLASPQQVRPLAEFLHQRGYSVYALRLPAHATSPGHLNEADWRMWLDSMNHSYSLLRRSCSQVVVGGVSLGGILAMLLASQSTIHPAAVFAVNPPFKLRDRRAMFVPAMLRWQGALDRLGWNSDGRLIVSNTETPDLSYHHHTLHAVNEVRRAAAECRDRLKNISVPAMIMQAEGDPVVVPEASHAALANTSSDLKMLARVSFDRHNIVCGERKEIVFQSLHRFILRVTAGSDPPVSRDVIYRTRSGRRSRLARAGFIRMFT